MKKLEKIVWNLDVLIVCRSEFIIVISMSDVEHHIISSAFECG